MDGTTLPNFRAPNDEWYATTKAVLSRLDYLAVPLLPMRLKPLAASDAKLKEATKEIEDSEELTSEEPALAGLLTGLGHLRNWAQVLCAGVESVRLRSPTVRTDADRTIYRTILWPVPALSRRSAALGRPQQRIRPLVGADPPVIAAHEAAS